MVVQDIIVFVSLFLMVLIALYFSYHSIIHIREFKGLLRDYFKYLFAVVAIISLIGLFYFTWRTIFLLTPERLEEIQLYFDIVALVLVILLAVIGFKLSQGISSLGDTLGVKR